MSNSGPNPSKPNGANGTNGGGPAGVSLSGGAAIMAPVAAFQGGIPQNALVVIPITQPTEELGVKLAEGPVVVTQEQMWKLLGFNGPAVQVQDDQGRPIVIGLDDLLSGLQKHWDEAPDDVNRGRMLAQELLKHGRLAQAETALAKIVARAGTGDDWLALGVTQLNQKKLEKAEATLRGAQNLMPQNPYPALHLAKAAQAKGDKPGERAMVEKAIATDPACVDAWGYLFQFVREADGEEKAAAELEALAATEANAKSVAPFVAALNVYANDAEARDKAVAWGKKALARDANDPMALVSLSALYGQVGDLQAVIDLLQPHEAKMSRDVRLANNYFRALFESRQIEKVTKLLNALAGSPAKDVKQFAIESSKAVAQFLQQQQAQLSAASQRKA